MPRGYVMKLLAFKSTQLIGRIFPERIQPTGRQYDGPWPVRFHTVRALYSLE